MRTAVVLSLLLFLPSLAAALQIDEIMYDLPGSDSGREWVEVYQDGTDCVNLTQWKFFEANTNHGITFNQGSGQICANEYAVIADNPANFLNDHVGFSGSLFDSSFSLSNTGETIALKNPDGNITDTVTYSSATGANGNGRSLERNSSGWFESFANATPGDVNSILQQPYQQPGGNQTFQQNATQSQNSSFGATQSGSSSQPSQSGINPLANYSPLIDFSLIGRSNRVPPGSAIETAVSVTSNYLVGRDVSFCSYVMAEALASDEACQTVNLLPDETKEMRLYNTLANVTGNLTLTVELRDGISTRQKSINIEVLPTQKKTEEARYSNTTLIEPLKGPTAAFAAKTDVISRIIGWLKNLLHLSSL